jgi:rhodanese-related sulfurtransferase
MEMGFEAAALEGGYRAWREKYPVEEKEETMGRARDVRA